jgi:acetyltransferase-like isoleucine patch superfamily enzyme
MATGRDKFRKIKGLISVWVALHSIFPYGFNMFLMRFFRNTNGKIGLLIRYVLLKNLCKSCGDNVSVQPGVYLFNLKNVTIGHNVSIHPMCYIDAAGGLEIGNDVSIAHASSIMTTNHAWDNTTIPIKYNPETFAKVTIAEDVWIGAGVRILAGVTIASRGVIAAGAVLNKSTESHAVYGGVPAKMIKKING